jgi:alkyl hydroperoxide reductase subunit AhpF
VRCDEAVALAREIVSLHPALTFTAYDLEQHADRAQEAGIPNPPVTVVRAHGRELRFVGLCSGALLRSLLDIILLAGVRTTPLATETRAAVHALPGPVTLDVYVAPYDVHSADMLLLVFGMAIESPHIRATAWEMSEFPELALQRGITELPVIVVNGRRFVGAWGEQELVQQLQRSVAGDVSPVIRDRLRTTPYVSARDGRRAAATSLGLARPGGPPPPTPFNS